jgi:hypothetical protein
MVVNMNIQSESVSEWGKDDILWWSATVMASRLEEHGTTKHIHSYRLRIGGECIGENGRVHISWDDNNRHICGKNTIMHLATVSIKPS